MNSIESTKKDETNKLTSGSINPKKEKFAQCIASGMSQSQAAVSSGYSSVSPKDTGSRLAKDSEVRARIEELVQEALDFHGITPAWIIEKIKNAIEVAERKPIISRVSGEIVDYDQDGRTILQGCELLAKIAGMMCDGSEIPMQPLGMSAMERRIYLIGYFKQHKIVMPGYTTPEDIIIDAPKTE